MKKVALVIPSLSSGGAERVMSVLANEWCKESGIETHLFILTNLPDFYNIDSNVTIHRIGFDASKKNRLVKSFRLVKAMFKFRKEIRKLSPLFVLSFLTQVNLFVLVSLFFRRDKIFVSERNSPNLKRSTFFEKTRKWFYNYSDGIIVQSNTFKNLLENNGYKSKVKVISNPVQKLYAKPYSSLRERYILNVGRLVDQKDHKRLLDIYDLVAKKEKGWKLIIAGDGPLRDELIQYSIKLGLSDSVEFRGECKEILDLYNSAQIFAFTSKYEGFPNALAEAMYCGIPCVSFDCVTGPSELIKSGYNGFLVPEKDNQAFAQRLLTLMSSECLRQEISENSLKIKAKLDSEKVALDYLEFCMKNT